MTPRGREMDSLVTVLIEWLAILAARAVALGPLGRQLGNGSSKVDVELALRELQDPDRYLRDDPFGAFD